METQIMSAVNSIYPDILFSKMHGAGNDFVVIDAINQNLSHMSPTLWRALAHRQLGVGADQILLVQPSEIDGVDFMYRIFNQDGSMVENCGNGARCFVRFVIEQGLSQKRQIRAHLVTGQVLQLALNDDNTVTVDMGAPMCVPECAAAVLPVDISSLPTQTIHNDTAYGFDLSYSHSGKTADTTRWLSLVSMGNPHAVQIVDDVKVAPVVQEGALIESHSRFARNINAGFMSVVSRNEVHVRVFERGAGETLACGTGICAAVVTGIRRGLLDPSVLVHARGGLLRIQWAGDQHSVMMTGPTKMVFTSRIAFATLQDIAGQLAESVVIQTIATTPIQ
jgi:diaminopimelate epimerase